MSYKIYHIPGVKIGCSIDPKSRVRKQGYTDYEILEEHTDIHIASDREIELQEEYGYGRDNKPYYMTVAMPTKEGCSKGGIKSGRNNANSGHMKSIASMGGLVGGKKNADTGQVMAMGKKYGPANAKRMNNTKYICPHCDKEGKSPSMKRWHFDNCKNKI